MKLCILRSSAMNGSKSDWLRVLVSWKYRTDESTLNYYNNLKWLGSHIVIFAFVSIVYVEGLRGNVQRENPKEGNHLQNDTANHPCGDRIAASFGIRLSHCTLARLRWAVDVSYVPSGNISAQFLSALSNDHSESCRFRIVDLLHPRISIKTLPTMHRIEEEWAADRVSRKTKMTIEFLLQIFSLVVDARFRLL